MRVAKRNWQTAYYQIPMGKRDLTDKNGNLTGKHELLYAPKVKFKSHIHFGAENAYYRPYGIQSDYSLSLYFEKLPSDDWTEETVLWIGDTDKPNYIITAIAPNLSGILVRAKEFSGSVATAPKSSSATVGKAVSGQAIAGVE